MHQLLTPTWAPRLFAEVAFVQRQVAQMLQMAVHRAHASTDRAHMGATWAPPWQFVCRAEQKKKAFP